MPEQHTPPADSVSSGPPPRRPWTMEAKPGTSTSPWVVPAASMPTSARVMPRSARAAVTARAASSSFSMVVLPWVSRA